MQFFRHGVEWCGYPTVKKNFENMFTRFDIIHKREGQTEGTDRQTDTARRHRPRLCIASRGKNQMTTEAK